MKKIIFVLFLSLLTLPACHRNQEQESNSKQSIEKVKVAEQKVSPKVEQQNFKPKTDQVISISACARLNLKDLYIVYPKKGFNVVSQENNPASLEEAASNCKYEEVGKDDKDKYLVDIDLIVKKSNQDALKILETADSKKSGKEIKDLGSKAYYLKLSETNSIIEFVNDNVYYKINVESSQPDASKTFESELTQLAKRVIEL